MDLLEWKSVFDQILEGELVIVLVHKLGGQ